MHNNLNNAILASKQKAQYDACAKSLLAQKIILAHILVKTVDEFMDMDPKDVAGYIEGDPYISTMPIEPGLTNVSNPERLVGLNTEDAEINEGLVRFDIIFYVRMKDGLSQIIINVEAQKSEPGEYDILNRATFYVCRLISSQKDRDFVSSHYDDIKRVYSIWICMNMDENTMCHYHMTKDDMVGCHEWKGRSDLINIIMIGLGRELPENDDDYELHRLLEALLSSELSATDKLDIISSEYSIPIEDGIREEVNLMCNLSEGVEERGIEKGMQKGLEEGMQKGLEKGMQKGADECEARLIKNMHTNGFTLKQIVDVTNKLESEVQTIIET